MTSFYFSTWHGQAFFVPNTEDEKVQMNLLKALPAEEFEEIFNHKPPADWHNMTGDDVEEMLDESGYDFTSLINVCVERLCEHVTANTYGWDYQKDIEEGTVYYVGDKTTTARNGKMEVPELNDEELAEMKKLQEILEVNEPIEGKFWSIRETA